MNTMDERRKIIILIVLVAVVIPGLIGLLNFVPPFLNATRDNKIEEYVMADYPEAENLNVDDGHGIFVINGKKYTVEAFDDNIYVTKPDGKCEIIKKN